MSALRWLLIGSFVTLPFYVALGVGYHRVSDACYDSRHSLDGDSGALDSGESAVADVVLWPLLLVFTPADTSCEPVPVAPAQ